MSPFGAELKFAEPATPEQLAQTDAGVRFLVQLSLLWAFAHGIKAVWITSVNTPAAGRTTKTHEELRAADEGLLAGSLTMSEEFADWVNGRTEWGQGRVAVVVGKYDKDGRHDDHIHLQVPRPFEFDRKLRLYGADS